MRTALRLAAAVALTALLWLWRHAAATVCTDCNRIGNQLDVWLRRELHAAAMHGADDKLDSKAKAVASCGSVLRLRKTATAPSS